MYGLIWRKLPGGLPGKLAGTLVLTGAVIALLFLVVFPWASPRLPFDHVTVNPPTTNHSSQVSHLPNTTMKNGHQSGGSVRSTSRTR